MKENRQNFPKQKEPENHCHHASTDNRFLENNETGREISTCLWYSKTRGELKFDVSGLIPNLCVYIFINLEDATEIIGHRASNSSHILLPIAHDFRVPTCCKWIGPEYRWKEKTTQFASSCSPNL